VGTGGARITTKVDAGTVYYYPSSGPWVSCGAISNNEYLIINGTLSSSNFPIHKWNNATGTFTTLCTGAVQTSPYTAGAMKIDMNTNNILGTICVADSLLDCGLYVIPVGAINITSFTPNNYTFTETSINTFNFSVNSIVGTWNTTLWLNNSLSYGSNNSITTTGYKTIVSSALPSGHYLYWINATLNSTSSVITEKRNIYIVGTSSSTSCVQSFTNWYFVPNGCGDTI
jgi:hypothetical protein